jgi:hypothetical protein
LREHPQRGWFVARSETDEGIGCLVVSPEDMVELESIELLLQLLNLLPLCCHARVATVRLSHDLVVDELRVTTDMKLLNHVDVFYASPQAHGIVNVALHREYSPGRYSIYIFPREEGSLSYLRLTQRVNPMSTTRLYRSYINWG